MRKITFRVGKFIFLLALVIRLWGIRADLPNVYHPDEPHHLNIAARFGAGDLNPHDFKYPTLWSYAIAVVFGFLYLYSKLAGVVTSAQQFAVLFLTSPTMFYLSVRVLAALAVSGGIWLLVRAAENYYSTPVAVVFGLLAALTPELIKHGGEATPYGLMLFFLCAAIFFLQGMQADGLRRNYRLGGLALGLAASCHYTAAVFGAWLVALHFTRPREERNDGYLLEGILFCAIGFFIGTPFALLDWNTFAGSLLGLKHSQSTDLWKQPAFSPLRTVQILKNIVFFMDRWGIGFILALIGFVQAQPRKKMEFVAWLSPILIVFPFLALSTFGTGVRYLMGSYLILLLLAASGFVSLWKRLKAPQARAMISILVFVPMIVAVVKEKREAALPDTRTQAENWILQNVPSGTKILLTDPFYCPQLDRDQAQIDRLLKKTQALNNPRQAYFRILAQSHPAGGYEIYYLRRTVQEILDIPERVEPAYQGQEWFDLENGGLAPLKKEGIRYFVLDGSAASNRRDSAWMVDLTTHYQLATQFTPPPKEGKGPFIWIFDLTRQNPDATKKSATKA